MIVLETIGLAQQQVPLLTHLTHDIFRIATAVNRPRKKPANFRFRSTTMHAMIVTLLCCAGDYTNAALCLRSVGIITNRAQAKGGILKSAHGDQQPRYTPLHSDSPVSTA